MERNQRKFCLFSRVVVFDHSFFFYFIACYAFKSKWNDHFFPIYFILEQIVSLINVNEVIHVKWNSNIGRGRERESAYSIIFCYVMHKCSMNLYYFVFSPTELLADIYFCFVYFIFFLFVFSSTHTHLLTRSFTHS